MNKIIIALLFLSFTSCILQSPKYTTLDKVMTLKLGMTKDEVEHTLNLVPYDIKSITDSSHVFIYVYRVTDRKTIAFYTKERNGRHSKGKYVQLQVAYSVKDSKVIHIESCNMCPDNLVASSRVRVDLEKVATFVSVTLPVILVYIGLKKEE